MVVIYSLVRILLAFTHWLMLWRCRAADWRSQALAVESDTAVKYLENKDLSTGEKLRRQLSAARALEESETATSVWERWQKRCDRMAAVRAFDAGFFGRCCFYLAGVADICTPAMGLIYSCFGATPDEVVALACHTIRSFGGH